MSEGNMGTPAREGWIGVDLDGTLAHYEGWNGGAIGAPIPAMMARVRAWLAEGRTVKIFTARVCDPAERPKVQEWLMRNGLPALEVTNVKDFDMLELWDDRAVQVVKNTGERVGAVSRL